MAGSEARDGRCRPRRVSVAHVRGFYGQPRQPEAPFGLGPGFRRTPSPLPPLAARGWKHRKPARVSLFLGTVRDHSAARKVTTSSTRPIRKWPRGTSPGSSRARERWPLIGVAVEHRVGSLAVGRRRWEWRCRAPTGRSLEAVRYLIDELKARVPLWKKEHWTGEPSGSARKSPPRPQSIDPETGRHAVLAIVSLAAARKLPTTREDRLRCSPSRTSRSSTTM